MKKKVLSLALALVMVLAMAIPAFAEEITLADAGGTGNTAMTYTVATSYTVIIPEAVTIASRTGTLEVGVAANAAIAKGSSILIKLTTCDLTLTNTDANDDLAYTIKNDATENVAVNGTVLTHAAGDLAPSSEILTINTAYPKYTGIYTDSVTFTVSIDSPVSEP